MREREPLVRHTGAGLAVEAADSYARALRDHGYTPRVAELRNEMKAAIRALVIQRDFAIEVAHNLVEP